ncbi:hypothetical protein N7486_010890 [Penicillium sp. IBT 16267x]|nr:hypothetical protein N7486_010890 [Penicillium sp. IBT 16267x]
MLLNLGLTADAAAAHNPDPSAQPGTPPAPSSSPSYSPAFSLATLPILGSLYNRTKQVDDPIQPVGSISGVAMSPIAFKPSEGESSKPTMSALSGSRVSRSNTNTTRKSIRSKTSYQLAHPASHARHKRLKLRPKLLLQLQQVSHTPRPLPILDVLPSTLYLPRLARKFPAMFRGKNGLGPNDLIIVMSELYEHTVASTQDRPPSSEDDDDDHREVVATICQMLQDDALQRGKAEICLNFGPTWEATPLPSGSYEFVACTKNGLQVMRWALRAGRNRRMSAQPSSEPREDNKRFTFSVIDPNTRRHPVIASMTRNQLEVFDEYNTVTRSNTGPTTPSSGMSVISDLSDNDALDLNTDANVVTVEDGLRTLIIVTGIWVAFREGWSSNFNYGDPLSSPVGKNIVSPASSKFCTPTNTKSENNSPTRRDELNDLKEVANGNKRCASVSSVHRSNTLSPIDGVLSSGSLSRRSNSTGAAFMDRAKRRSASAGNRLNRHSAFTGTGENGREIVVSRPSSIRLNSAEAEDSSRAAQLKNKSKAKTADENSKPTKPGHALRSYPDHHPVWDADDIKEPELAPPGEGKSKRRHRFSSLFTIFHRKERVH